MPPSLKTGIMLSMLYSVQNFWNKGCIRQARQRSFQQEGVLSDWNRQMSKRWSPSKSFWKRQDPGSLDSITRPVVLIQHGNWVAFSKRWTYWHGLTWIDMDWLCSFWCVICVGSMFDLCFEIFWNVRSGEIYIVIIVIIVILSVEPSFVWRFWSHEFLHTWQKSSERWPAGCEQAARAAGVSDWQRRSDWGPNSKSPKGRWHFWTNVVSWGGLEFMVCKPVRNYCKAGHDWNCKSRIPPFASMI